MEEGMKNSISNGRSLKFWLDSWCELVPLKDKHPRLYNISTQKQNLIYEMGFWRGEAWIWKLSWRRSLFDWEKEELYELEQTIDRCKPQLRKFDKVESIWNKEKQFIVRDFVKKMGLSIPDYAIPKPAT